MSRKYSSGAKGDQSSPHNLHNNEGLGTMCGFRLESPDVPSVVKGPTEAHIKQVIYWPIDDSIANRAPRPLTLSIP